MNLLQALPPSRFSIQMFLPFLIPKFKQLNNTSSENCLERAHVHLFVCVFRRGFLREKKTWKDKIETIQYTHAHS